MAVVANAIALLVAALILSRFDIEPLPFIVVAIIFTIATMFIKPVAENLAGNFASGATWIAGLVTVLLGLIIANALTGSAMSIDGFWTWVWATLIVFAGTLAYDVVDDQIIARVGKQFGIDPGATSTT